MQPRIGPYCVLGKLGAGGMGEVYLAKDPRLQRRVALKVLRVAAGDDAARRTLREARTAARLNHPGIAAIHDVLDWDDQTFIVMEYVEGRPLETVLRDGALPVPVALELGIQLCEAVAAAHAAGVIHGDIKPSNVMMTSAGTLKVLDLGVARLTAPAPGADPSSTETTRSREVAGTPAYMSPECLLGREGDERSDLYSIGLVLFEMLTGRRARASGDSLQIALSSSHAPDSIRQLRPEVPADVDRIVRGALALDPAQRPASVRELADSLKSVDHGVSTGPDSAHSSRRRARLLPLTIVAAFVVPLVWLAARGRVPDGPAGPIVVLPPANLSGDSQTDVIGIGLGSLLSVKLAALPEVTVIPAAAAAAYRRAGRDPQEAAHALGATYAIDITLHRTGSALSAEARLLREGAQGTLWETSLHGTLLDVERRLFDEVPAALERSGAFRRRLSASDRDRLRHLPTSSGDALVEYARGRMLLEQTDTRGALDQAIDAFHRALQLDPKFVMPYAGLIEAFTTKFAETRDRKWIDEAQALTTRPLELAPREPSIHAALATFYLTTGQIDLAMRHARTAADLWPFDDNAHRLLGRILARSGRIDEATTELRRAIALRPDYWGHYYELGFALYRAGRYRDAIPAFTRVTELRPSSPDGFQALGTVYHITGNVDAAIGAYEHALRVGESPAAVANLGFAYYAAGQLDRALNMYERQVSLEPRSPSAHRNLADILSAVHRPDEAAAHYTRATELAEAALQVNPRDAPTIALLALCEVKLNRPDAARRHAAEAALVAPDDNEVIYDLAIVQALTGNPADAARQLQRAIDLGYPATFARRDPNLAGLRTRADVRVMLDAAIQSEGSVR